MSDSEMVSHGALSQHIAHRKVPYDQQMNRYGCKKCQTSSMKLRTGFQNISVTFRYEVVKYFGNIYFLFARNLPAASMRFCA